MGYLTEENFQEIKLEIQEGRLTMDRMKFFLIAAFLYSIVFVGMGYAVAHANTVGWDNLSAGWHIIFYMEAILFAVQLMFILFFWKKSNRNQKVLSFGMVLFTYKMVVDPFIFLAMILKDEGIYQYYISFFIWLLIIGLVVHVAAMFVWINKLKKITDQNAGRKYTNTALLASIIFFLVVVLNQLTRNWSYQADTNFFIFVFVLVYLGLIIFVCEFNLAAYGIFRYPELSVEYKPTRRQNEKQKKEKK